MIKSKSVAKPAGRAAQAKGGARTNIVLDRALIDKAKAKANVSTAREAVQVALQSFVASHDYSAVLDLIGSGAIDDDYDPKNGYGTRG